MAQPALADARISCPVCHAPVHPIAGRCKHCKADLVRMRGGSTGAGEMPVAIPTLGPGGAPAAAPLPLPGARSGGAMPALAAAPASSVEPTSHPHPPLALPTSPVQAALPGPGPRLALPAGSAPVASAGSYVVPPRVRRAGWSWSQRWPLVVAVVAAAAILASLAVLLLGDDQKPRPIRALGPAPERMDTDVGPPSTPRPPATTPRPSDPPPGQPGTAPDPVDPFDPPPAAGVDPDDLQPPADPAAPIDPFAPASPPRGAGVIPRVDDAGEFLTAAIDLGCERVLACTGASADAQALCSQARSMRDTVAGSLGLSCTHFDSTAARTCLRAIAGIPCPGSGATDPGKLASLLMGVPACGRVCGP